MTIFKNETSNFSNHDQTDATICYDRFHNGIKNGDYTLATELSYLLAIIINSLACPGTVLLNVLVIMAVKKRPRLQSKTNVLLACLAATDLLSGFVSQPLFIAWKTFQLRGVPNNCLLRTLHNDSFRNLSVASLLHLSLVTFERLIAIKCSMRYAEIITAKNIKIAIALIWLICLLCQVGFEINGVAGRILSIFIGFIIGACILFVLSCYIVLFLETRRHRKMIKSQQISQEEAARVLREDKALKTTVMVVSSLILCYLPMCIALISRPEKGYDQLFFVILPWVRSMAMLNSFLNPIIYCIRQKEMRQFIFRISSSSVGISG